MRKVDKKSAEPIYRQVVNHIKSDMDRGALTPGRQLPPEPELAEIYGVSRITIRKVLTQLSNEGLVSRRKGKGTFVSQPRSEISPLSFGIVSFGTELLEANEYDYEILSGIMKELGAASPLTTVYWRESLEPSYLKNNFTGLFLMHPTGDDFKHLKNILMENMPVVFVSSAPRELRKYPKVSIDNYSGSDEAMRLLIKKGRRRIAFVSGLLDKSSTFERFSAYKDNLRVEGIEFDANLVKHMPDSDEIYGMRAMKQLLELPERPDSVFASTDLMAIGAMKAIRDAGMSVPENLSIVGFDNSRTAPYLSPRLTTVDSDSKRIGAESAKLLLRILDGESVGDVTIKSSLVIRDSA
jgi:DNA-binding LacI/PurR family transcriptional regulator